MKLSAILESLLFVAGDPVTPAQLAQASGCPEVEVTKALAALQQEYEEENRGLRVQRRDGRVLLVTNPAASQVVEDFLNLDLRVQFSAPALETLAIIAYLHPVTRAQVEAVRGVDCAGVLRKLLQQGLVEEFDRLEGPGRPIRYAITDQFMQHFGLTSLEELPPLENDGEAISAELAQG